MTTTPHHHEITPLLAERLATLLRGFNRSLWDTNLEVDFSTGLVTAGPSIIGYLRSTGDRGVVLDVN